MAIEQFKIFKFNFKILFYIEEKLIFACICSYSSWRENQNQQKSVSTGKIKKKKKKNGLSQENWTRCPSVFNPLVNHFLDFALETGIEKLRIVIFGYEPKAHSNI